MKAQKKHFRAEIDILCKTKHPNIVSLLGLCTDDEDVPYILYEFLPNGNLNSLIHSSTGTSCSWARRYNIALNVAEGLSHLHSCDILHKDIKGENVLLDVELQAKIADFGLSRFYSAENDEFRVTSALKGTFGYMCPQYRSDGIYGPSSDTFSFGVLLIQMLTGKPALFPGDDGTNRSLAIYFREEFKSGRLGSIFDPNVADPDEQTQMVLRHMAKIARDCVSKKRNKRPLMKSVVQQLQELKPYLPAGEPKSPKRLSMAYLMQKLRVSTPELPDGGP